MAKKSKYAKWFEEFYGPRPATRSREVAIRRKVQVLRDTIKLLESRVRWQEHVLEAVREWDKNRVATEGAWYESRARLIQEHRDVSLGRQINKGHGE